MKLSIILLFAIIGFNLLAKPNEKIERKLASINVSSAEITSALSKIAFIKNSQSMVHDLTKTTSYKCAENIQSSELKDIEIVISKKDTPSFKFNAVRMCFDQAGPGVIEVHYDGVLRGVAGDLTATEVKIKLVQDSND